MGHDDHFQISPAGSNDRRAAAFGERQKIVGPQDAFIGLRSKSSEYLPLPPGPSAASTVSSYPGPTPHDLFVIKLAAASAIDRSVRKLRHRTLTPRNRSARW